MVVEYRPLAGFAEGFTPPAIKGGRVVTPGCPGLLADVAMAPDGEGAAVRFTLAAGQERSFSLYADALPRTPPDTRALMERTLSAWVLWTQDAAYTGPLADELIRSALVRDGVAEVRSGAGVVHDSVPQAEADETRAKASALLGVLGA